MIQWKFRARWSEYSSWRVRCSWWCWTATRSTILHSWPRLRWRPSSSTSKYNHPRYGCRFNASPTFFLLPPPRRLCFYRFQPVSLFVSKQDYAKTTQPIFTKFGGKVAHGPRKKPLDFSGYSTSGSGSKNFKRNSSFCGFVSGKGSSSPESKKIRRLADLRLNKLKSYLGGGLRPPSASIPVQFMHFLVVPYTLVYIV